MKNVILTLIFMFIMTMSVNAMQTAKTIAVFPIDIPSDGSNYSIYPSTTNMLSADLVNELRFYNDLQPIDISLNKEIIQDSGLTKKYQTLIEEYKNLRTINYTLLEEISNVLGAQYVIFVHGGYDLQRSVLKPNMFFKLQWIWAPSVTPSTRYDVNMLLVDVRHHRYLLEKSYKHNFKMDDFMTPSQSFGENISTLAQIKKFTKPNSKLFATRVYASLFNKGEKNFADKSVQAETLSTDYTKSKEPQNTYYSENEVPFPITEQNNTYNNYSEYQNQEVSQNEINEPNPVNIRKEYYKNWVEVK